MWHEIGQAAGQVMRYLEGKPEASSLQVRSALRLSQTHLYLALGWLAREGKIDLIYRDRAYWVVPKG